LKSFETRVLLFVKGKQDLYVFIIAQIKWLVVVVSGGVSEGHGMTDGMSRVSQQQTDLTRVDTRSYFDDRTRRRRNKRMAIPTETSTKPREPERERDQSIH
jgi:hypothetical protein